MVANDGNNIITYVTMRFNYANACQLNYANISMLHVYINKSPV